MALSTNWSDTGNATLYPSTRGTYYYHNIGYVDCYYKTGSGSTAKGTVKLYLQFRWVVSYNTSLGKYQCTSTQLWAQVSAKVNPYSYGSIKVSGGGFSTLNFNLSSISSSGYTFVGSYNPSLTHGPYTSTSTWIINMNSITLTVYNSALSQATKTGGYGRIYIPCGKNKFTLTYKNASGGTAGSTTFTYGNQVTLTTQEVKKSSTKENKTVTLSYASGESGQPAPSSQSSASTAITNYTHSGWTIGSSTYGLGSKVTLYDETTAYAAFRSSSSGYPSVTFTLDSGDSMSKSDILSKTNYLYYNMNGGNGNIQTVSKQISRAKDYTFTGWKIDYTTYPGGSNYSTNESKTATGQYTIDLPEWLYEDVIITSVQPTRTGYNFLGWAPTSNATSASYLGGDALTLDKDITLYAVWEPEKHNTIVHFYSMSNGKYDQIKIREDMVYEGYYNTNTSNSYIAIPVINGYQTPSVLSTDLKNTSTVSTKLDYTADHEYYVLYTLLFNTITLNLNSVSGATTLLNNSPSNYTYQYCVRDNTQEIRSNYIPTSVLGNTRYCFLGWNTLANGNGTWVESIVPSNVTQWGVTNTYYAQWLPLGRYIYKNNAWHGITNMWVYSNGTWKTTDITSYTNDLLKTKTTFWTYKDGSWHKEYGGRL